MTLYHLSIGRQNLICPSLIELFSRFVTVVKQNGMSDAPNAEKSGKWHLFLGALEVSQHFTSILSNHAVAYVTLLFAKNPPGLFTIPKQNKLQTNYPCRT